MKRILPVAMVTTVLLFCSAAQAGISRKDIFHGSAGGLFTLGGNLWTEPDHSSTYSMDGVPFGDTAGGLGVGGGFFFQARFIKWIGLEVDFLFEYDHQWYNIEYDGGVADVRYHMRYTLIRIPILLQVVFNTPSMRITLGLGPEFTVSRNNHDDVTVESGAVLNRDEIERLFNTRKQSDVNLCVALGFAFKVWKLSIPFNIRFAYNGTQPDDYLKRLELSGGSTEVVASQSMDLRLMTGLAYDF